MTALLHTERLTLRPHTAADFDAAFALWSDPGVTRFITGRAGTRDEVWARVLRYIGHWAALGYGFWAIEERATGRFVGECGFADFKRDIDPPILVPEAGWALRDEAAGKGYALEALAAAHAWADAHFTTPTRCIIDPENARSIRLAEKLGYCEIQRTTFKDQPTIIFERPAGGTR